jgi:serine/threonine-protein kinase
VAANDPARIAQHYTGTLLEGFHLGESVEFGYWLDQTRTELVHGYVGALRTLAEAQERSGDVHGRIATCRRLVAVDPHSGAHVRALMRALEAAGDRRAALRLAEEHTARLRKDLELEPDTGVVSLAEKLRTAPAPPVTRSGVYARQPAVAVLPFVTLGAKPDHDDFADGITEDVIAQLAKISTLQVIARSSVLPFESRRQSLKEIGATLGATKLLDGSVRRSGDRVRIVATLIDVRTDRHLWAETYDRQVTDIFAIQTDVALQIAAALKAKLSPQERTRLQKQPTSDIQAHRLYLQGRRWLTQYAAQSYLKAIDYFERAIARDPAFALAWANLSIACTEMGEMGAAPPADVYPRAQQAAQRAFTLDPELGEAHVAQGFLQYVCEFDWDGAELSFRRALDLSPSNADAFDLYGRMCSAMQRYDDAIALLERAQELDPLVHRVDLATALLRAGRYDQALERAREAVDLDPEHDRARATLGWAYFLSGRQPEGLIELERAVTNSGRSSLWLGQLGQAYGMTGNEEKARDILGELETRGKSGYVSPYHLAYVHIGLGEMNKAFELVEQVADEKGGPVHGVKGSFLLAPLQEHPRFQALLEKMNLP